MQSFRSESTEIEAPCLGGVLAKKNMAGFWYLLDVESGQVSAECFVSLKVANMALEGGHVTWEQQST